MTPAPSTMLDRLNAWLRESITLKLLGIGILLLLLLIPSNMVQSLITERADNRDAATSEISAQWGGPQLLIGPVVVLPYTVRSTDAKGRVEESTSYVSFLPDTLATTGTLAPERRHRGIYEAVVYRAQLQVRGSFEGLPLAEAGVNAADVHWNEAFAVLGISDMKGIRSGLALRWDGQAQRFEPGVPAAGVLPSGSAPSISSQGLATMQAQHSYSRYVDEEDETQARAAGPTASGLHARLPLTAASLGQRHTFAFDLDLNGSTGLLLAPLGRQTTARLQAPWADPSFIGAFLPAERSLSAEKFTARWQVLHLNRSYPQHWRASEMRPDVDESTFGVRLLVPVNEYQKTMRAAKYALLPLALTFLVFFFVEVLHRRRIHPFQYLLVGLALVIFYVLLLALSEQLAFDWAYGLSAVVIVGLVTAYAAASFRQRRPALLTAGVLALVYGFVFVVLQLQDYALLVGSLGLVVVLAAVMFLSRNIDWYNPAPRQE